jgi:hypothetical protein
VRSARFNEALPRRQAAVWLGHGVQAWFCVVQCASKFCSV